MDALKTLIVRAQAHDLDAFSDLVRRFQDMAVGYAYAILGDFHLAEDAAQDAFVQAYLDIGALREPAAFAGWFRRIVWMRCNRLTRKKQVPTVPLDAALVSGAPRPDEVLEIREIRAQVHRAIQDLPDAEREVIALYYMSGYAQREIGAFLEIPTKTVKSRLFSARKRLRERMAMMVKDNLQEQRPSNDPDFQVKVLRDMEEIAQLTDRDIQRMLRETETTDLALAMIDASDAFKERINVNISARVGNIISEYIKSQMPVSQDRVEKHQAKLVQIAQALIAKGAITYPPQEEKAPAKKPDKIYLETKANLLSKLQHTPVSQMDFQALTETMVFLAEVVRREGTLHLEEIVTTLAEGDGFFSLGMQWIVDGVSPKLLEEVLATRKKVLLQHDETRLDMIIAGIRAIQLGEDPNILDLKLRAMY